MSEATILSKLGEFRGIISRALVSSTYLMRSRQTAPVRQQTVSHHRKEDHTQFGSLGTPPFSVNQSDKVPPILTACFRFVKNAAIHAKRAG